MTDLSAEDAALVAEVLRDGETLLENPPGSVEAGTACRYCRTSYARCSDLVLRDYRDPERCDGCCDECEDASGHEVRRLPGVTGLLARALADERRRAGEREGLVWSAGFAEGVKYAEDRGWHLSDTDRAKRAAALDADGRTGADQGEGALAADEPEAAEGGALVEASSLGTPEAKALRATVSDERAARIVKRAEELAEVRCDCGHDQGDHSQNGSCRFWCHAADWPGKTSTTPPGRDESPEAGAREEA